MIKTDSVKLFSYIKCKWLYDLTKTLFKVIGSPTPINRVLPNATE